MATLTKSTGTVTLSGAAEKVTLPASYGWVWVKNMSDSDIFAGLSADISEGADGVLTIPSGECGRIQTDGFSSIYLLGTGNALVVAQNYADCPFKLGSKGGESPDLSAYAKKTDIPTELPANGGNADYANNLSDWAGIELTNANDAPLGISRIIGDDYPDGNAPFDFWATILTLGPNERNDYRQQFAFPWSVRESAFFPKYRTLDGGTWGKWIQIYTSANKPYVTGSVTVAANSDVCESNHGFTPSAVIWWDGNKSGVAVSFNETQFVIGQASASERMVNYMIFK